MGSKVHVKLLSMALQGVHSIALQGAEQIRVLVLHVACRSERAMMRFESELGIEEGNARTRALLRSLSQVIRAMTSCNLMPSS